MQFIDASIYTIAIGSVVFFSAQFVIGLVKRHRPQTATPIQSDFVPNPDGFSDATIEEAELVEWHQKFVALHWAKQPTNNVVLFRRPVTTPDWAKLDPYTLRKECQKRSIKWRGVNGGKHLTKAQMVEALRRLSA